MTTPTNSHKAWTDKGGHVTLTGRVRKSKKMRKGFVVI